MQDIPHQMRRIAIRGGKGPAEALHSETVEPPAPKAGEILIRVRASGVNRPDLLQRQGAYPPPPGAPDTLGLEVAGEVAGLGDGAARWRVGDRVCALLGGGGYAQYVAVDARQALPIPDGVDLVQAAALPETVFTVFPTCSSGRGCSRGRPCWCTAPPAASASPRSPWARRRAAG